MVLGRELTSLLFVKHKMPAKSNIWYGFIFSAFILLMLRMSQYPSPSTYEANLAFNKNQSLWPVYLKPSWGRTLDAFDLKSLPKDERKFMESYLPIMKERSKTVSEYCENHPEAGNLELPKSIMWITGNNVEKNIVWCVNTKVGSGTWTKNFLRVAHFNEKNPLIKKLPLKRQEKARFRPKYGAYISVLNEVFHYPKSEKEKNLVLRNAIRLIIVRHPFVRVVSAYRAKISGEHNATVEDDDLLRKRIISNFRSPQSSNKSPLPTFPEFVRYIIAINQSPEFEDTAVKTVLKFWSPFWYHCSVCSFDYTVILKLETEQEDEKFLSILANLTEIKEKTKVERVHMMNNIGSENLSLKLFEELTKEEIWSLYNVYEHDFKLFNYDIKKYLPEN